MHPETPVMVKIGKQKLDGSYVAHVGDAIPLITLWEYLKVHTQLNMVSATHEIIDPGDSYSIYDVTTSEYVKLIQIELFRPTIPMDWRIIHFDDGRHLYVTAETEFEVVADNGTHKNVPAMYLCRDEAIARDTRLWWKMDAWPATWVRYDLHYGTDNAAVLGFTIPKIKPNHYYQLTTESGHFTASGLDVLCLKGS